MGSKGSKMERESGYDVTEGGRGNEGWNAVMEEPKYT
jgi:hypothetical protein